MYKIYALLLSVLLFSNCTRMPYTKTEPAFYYTTETSVPMYSSLAANAPPTNAATRDEQVWVVGRATPDWLVVRRAKNLYYVSASQLTTVRPAVVNQGYSPTPALDPGSSGGTYHTIQTGPRGGHYYINSNGNKTYVKHK